MGLSNLEAGAPRAPASSHYNSYILQRSSTHLRHEAYKRALLLGIGRRTFLVIVTRIAWYHIDRRTRKLQYAILRINRLGPTFAKVRVLVTALSRVMIRISGAQALHVATACNTGSEPWVTAHIRTPFLLLSLLPYDKSRRSQNVAT
jgi:hypothetical protein